MEAREFAEQMAGRMRQIIERGETAIPVAFAKQRGHDQLIVVGFEFLEDQGQSKDAASSAMRMMAKMPDVEYIVFISDTWIAFVEPKAEVDLSQGVRNVPGRKEAIAVTIFGRDRKTDVGYWVYERINGKATFPEKMTWAEEGFHCEGRFAPAGSGQEMNKGSA